MDGLVLAVTVVCVWFVAVNVWLGAVLRITLKTLLPETSGAFVGNIAAPSLELRPIVSLVLTRFQLASTERTVTLKAVPAVWALGEPLLPLVVPGTALSPGTSSWSLANAPELIVIEELVLAVFVPSVTSLAVTVALPAV